MSLLGLAFFTLWLPYLNLCLKIKKVVEGCNHRVSMQLVEGGSKLTSSPSIYSNAWRQAEAVSKMAGRLPNRLWEHQQDELEGKLQGV